MVGFDAIQAFDLVIGLVGALTMIYLLYSKTLVVAYPRFFKLTALGLLVFALTGPAFGRVEPALMHAVHGTAALFVCLGLFDLIAGELRRDDDFTALEMGVGGPPTDDPLEQD